MDLKTYSQDHSTPAPRVMRGRKRGQRVHDARKTRYGQAVQAHREQRGWSQRELATRLGYDSDSMISAIEQGTAAPSLEKAQDFAQLFETTIDAMCTFDGHLPAPEAPGRGGTELRVPCSRGTIHLRGWTLEETGQLLRILKEHGVLFDTVRDGGLGIGYLAPHAAEPPPADTAAARA